MFFITELLGDDPRVPEEVLTGQLIFKNLDGQELLRNNESRCWNHEALTAINLPAMLGSQQYNWGVDAFVLTHEGREIWIGSTEC